jgi:hypothetical protein
MAMAASDIVRHQAQLEGELVQTAAALEEAR